MYGFERFCGAKTSISYASGKDTFRRAKGKWEPAFYDEGRGVEVPARRVEPSYGEWIDRTVVMSFDPLPKREKIVKAGRARYSRLSLRSIPRGLGESAPYRKAKMSEEARTMQDAYEELSEQPDLDFIDAVGDEDS